MLPLLLPRKMHDNQLNPLWFSLPLSEQIPLSFVSNSDQQGQIKHLEIQKKGKGNVMHFNIQTYHHYKHSKEMLH